MAKPVLTTVLLCCLLVAPGFAIYDIDTVLANRWGVVLKNTGIFGCPGWWRAQPHGYLFGCGLWFGARDGADTLVTAGYCTNSGASEFTPGDSVGGANDPDARIYRWPLCWPPPQSRFPNAPQVPRSHGDVWTLYNDLDPAQHTAPGRPLGLQVWRGPATSSTSSSSSPMSPPTRFSTATPVSSATTTSVTRPTIATAGSTSAGSSVRPTDSCSTTSRSATTAATAYRAGTPPARWACCSCRCRVRPNSRR
jgi:hypothetical protein